MKIRYFCLGILLCAGCREDPAPRTESRAVDPELIDAPATSPASGTNRVFKTLLKRAVAEPPSEITGGGALQQEMEKMDQVRRLREYANQADPDDPFALTEKEIEEFSLQDDTFVN